MSMEGEIGTIPEHPSRQEIHARLEGTRKLTQYLDWIVPTDGICRARANIKTKYPLRGGVRGREIINIILKTYDEQYEQLGIAPIPGGIISHIGLPDGFTHGIPLYDLQTLFLLRDEFDEASRKRLWTILSSQYQHLNGSMPKTALLRINLSLLWLYGLAPQEILGSQETSLGEGESLNFLAGLDDLVAWLGMLGINESFFVAMGGHFDRDFPM